MLADLIETQRRAVHVITKWHELDQAVEALRESVTALVGLYGGGVISRMSSISRTMLHNITNGRSITRDTVEKLVKMERSQ